MEPLKEQSNKNQSSKNNKLNISDYQLSKTVGTGSFGRVKLIKHKKEKTIFALKMLKKSEIIRLKQVDHIYSEYTILSQIYHPFIVSKHLIIG